MRPTAAATAVPDAVVQRLLRRQPAVRHPCTAAAVRRYSEARYPAGGRAYHCARGVPSRNLHCVVWKHGQGVPAEATREELIGVPHTYELAAGEPAATVTAQHCICTLPLVCVCVCVCMCVHRVFSRHGSFGAQPTKGASPCRHAWWSCCHALLVA